MVPSWMAQGKTLVVVKRVVPITLHPMMHLLMVLLIQRNEERDAELALSRGRVVMIKGLVSVVVSAVETVTTGIVVVIVAVAEIVAEVAETAAETVETGIVATADAIDHMGGITVDDAIIVTVTIVVEEIFEDVILVMLIAETTAVQAVWATLAK